MLCVTKKCPLRPCQKTLLMTLSCYYINEVRHDWSFNWRRRISHLNSSFMPIKSYSSVQSKYGGMRAPINSPFPNYKFLCTPLLLPSSCLYVFWKFMEVLDLIFFSIFKLKKLKKKLTLFSVFTSHLWPFITSASPHQPYHPTPLLIQPPYRCFHIGH